MERVQEHAFETEGERVRRRKRTRSCLETATLENPFIVRTSEGVISKGLKILLASGLRAYVARADKILGPVRAPSTFRRRKTNHLKERERIREETTASALSLVEMWLVPVRNIDAKSIFKRERGSILDANGKASPTRSLALPAHAVWKSLDSPPCSAARNSQTPRYT